MPLLPKLSLNRFRNNPGLGEQAVGEQVYLAPPFADEAMVQAVRLISTRLSLHADEKSRLLFQQEANAASDVEYSALAPLFAAIPQPKKVLEIGPGLGRSVVYLGKKGVWAADAEVHLYDADGTDTKYKQKHYDAPPKWPDISSYCGNLPLLQLMLAYNGVTNYTLFNAAELALPQLPGPYDLIYGFYSVGFHWSLEHYLDDIEPLMGDRGILICTLNKHFAPFPRLGNFSTQVLQSRVMKKGARPLSFLVVSKAPLPEVGLSIDEAFAAR
jgi:hypothetical protein